MRVPTQAYYYFDVKYTREGNLSEEGLRELLGKARIQRRELQLPARRYGCRTHPAPQDDLADHRSQGRGTAGEMARGEQDRAQVQVVAHGGLRPLRRRGGAAGADTAVGASPALRPPAARHACGHEQNCTRYWYRAGLAGAGGLRDHRRGRARAPEMYVERRSRWHSPGKADDGDSGDITATFGNGRVFKGKYYQITDSTRVEHLDPLWDGWSRSARSSGWRLLERRRQAGLRTRVRRPRARQPASQRRRAHALPLFARQPVAGHVGRR